MTISMYDSYLERASLHRTQRIMDTAEATIYSQLTNEARRRMWNGWTNLVSHINTIMIQRDAIEKGGSPITWNGQVVNIRQLVNRFKNTFGKKSVVTQ